jgi:hypothetical protein
LEGEISERFRQLGIMIDRFYTGSSKAKISSDELERLADRLNNSIYSLNVRMITYIQESKVGIFNPDINN